MLNVVLLSIFLLNSLAQLDDTAPNWNIKFWTPISFRGKLSSRDPIVSLCKLDFKSYTENPHSYFSFRDLIAKSGCQDDNLRQVSLSSLKAELIPLSNDENNFGYQNVIQPTGFVFHEGRVGSTLVANLLASDPYSMVFSEADPPAQILMRCKCARHKQVSLLRDLLLIMGHSPIHKRVFFKFQSITTTMMGVVLETFPKTPWTFIFRPPIQTMVSQMHPENTDVVPCLRFKSQPPKEVAATMNGLNYKARSSDAAWCASHLKMLCHTALRAYDGHGQRKVGDRTVPHGFLLNYEGLPGLVPRVLLPLFGQREVSDTWKSTMAIENQFDAKSKSARNKHFGTENIGSTESQVTDSIQEYGNKLLGSTYDTLQNRSFDALQLILEEEEYDYAQNPVTGEIDWMKLSSLP